MVGKTQGGDVSTKACARGETNTEMSDVNEKEGGG